MAKERRVTLPAGAERVLDVALDKALAVQRPAVQAYLDRTHRRHPEMTPADVIRQLERRYVVAVTGIGGASGAAAAVPGTGTAASLASGAAAVSAFVSATALYVLALAELHSVPLSDPEVRRALVMSTLIGENGMAVVDGGEALADQHWAHVLGRTTPRDRVVMINGYLASRFVRRLGTRQGALYVGRALPLGIGVAIGAGGNAALARGAIGAARKAFGPAPSTYPPRVVDIRPRPRPHW